MARAVGTAAILMWPVTLLQRSNLLLHRPRIADDAASPVEHTLTLRREAVEARAAMDEENTERVLELLDPRRKRRLRHAARLGRPAEMLFMRESDQILQLVD